MIFIRKKETTIVMDNVWRFYLSGDEILFYPPYPNAYPDKLLFNGSNKDANDAYEKIMKDLKENVSLGSFNLVINL